VTIAAFAKPWQRSGLGWRAGCRVLIRRRVGTAAPSMRGDVLSLVAARGQLDDGLVGVVAPTAGCIQPGRILALVRGIDLYQALSAHPILPFSRSQCPRLFVRTVQSKVTSLRGQNAVIAARTARASDRGIEVAAERRGRGSSRGTGYAARATPCSLRADVTPEVHRKMVH